MQPKMPCTEQTPCTATGKAHWQLLVEETLNRLGPARNHRASGAGKSQVPAVPCIRDAQQLSGTTYVRG